jgi:phosphohistidine phosphatase
MEILLIRHAQAVDEAPGLGDAGRWITVKGRKLTRKVARWIAESDKRRPVTIWTSPLVRAVQTAEILASEVGYKGELQACAQLSPGHDPGDLIKLLGTEGLEGPLALVGHEPSLSLIVTALLGDIGFTGFKKSGVLGLRWEPPATGDGSAPSPGATEAPAPAAGKLWFLLDPATMKAAKRIDPRPATTEPPTAPPAEA